MAEMTQPLIHSDSSQKPPSASTCSRSEFIKLGGCAAIGATLATVFRRDSHFITDSSTQSTEPQASLHEVLNRLQRSTVEYFIQNRRHGLVLDQFPVANWPFSSMAATGFGLAALVIGAERGDIDRHRAAVLVDETLSTIESRASLRHRGWFTHFVDVSDPATPYAVRDSGRAEVPTAEYSSIDTALFFLAALPVATYFGAEHEIGGRIEALFKDVDFSFMLNPAGAGNRELFSHGFYLDRSANETFIPTRWDTCSEGILVSFLALADSSPQVPTNVWDAWSRDYQQLPLFVRYYPHCFMDLRQQVDRGGLDLWTLAEDEVVRQFQYCKKQGYPRDLFGVSACAFSYRDAVGKDQYGYFVPDFNQPSQPRVIAPHAVVSCMPFAPTKVRESLSRLSKHGWLESEFGPINSVNLDHGTVHRGVTAIDIGSALMMLDAAEARTIHQLAASTTRIQKALTNCGFKQRHPIESER